MLHGSLSPHWLIGEADCRKALAGFSGKAALWQGSLALPGKRYSLSGTILSQGIATVLDPLGAPRDPNTLLNFQAAGAGTVLPFVALPTCPAKRASSDPFGSLQNGKSQIC